MRHLTETDLDCLEVLAQPDRRDALWMDAGVVAYLSGRSSGRQVAPALASLARARMVRRRLEAGWKIFAYRITAAGLRALAAHQHTDVTRTSTGGGVACSETGIPAPGSTSEALR